jgi:hypothetical protein
VHLLDRDFALNIADVVWNTSRNLRDCVRIGELARSVEDVNFIADMFLKYEINQRYVYIFVLEAFGGAEILIPGCY